LSRTERPCLRSPIVAQTTRISRRKATQNGARFRLCQHRGIRLS
jgi:hypothetical protein